MAHRSTTKTVYTAKYHLIWCHKFRRRVPLVVPMSKLVLNGRSSRVLRKVFPHRRRLPSLRTPSWFLSTVGGAPLEVVRRSGENQKLVA
jgi:putative transposase